jgi:peptidyl-prolyl cis-trans isomerase B (cyclophilin B)
MSRGVKVKRVLVAVIAMSLVISPSAFAEDSPKTSVERCKEVKAKPRNTTKLPTFRTSNLKSFSTMVITTNCGNIEIALASELAPVTVSRIAFLVRNKYFDNSLCHRLTTSGIYVLQCGDPTTTGKSMPPGWKGFQDENLPVDTGYNYPAGTVAMANRGPGTNGSQFFLVYKDSKLPPNYSVWGQIKTGLDLLIEIGEVGAYQINKADKKAYYVGDGYSIQPVEIRRASVK